MEHWLGVDVDVGVVFCVVWDRELHNVWDVSMCWQLFHVDNDDHVCSGNRATSHIHCVPTELKECVEVDYRLCLSFYLVNNSKLDILSSFGEQTMNVWLEQEG